MVILILGLVAIGSCSYNMSTLSDFSVARRSGVSTMIKPGVAVLVIEGEIFDTSWAVEALRSFEDSDKVKALVLRINSPGGAVSPCQELYRAIREFTKPVVVSMGSVAASGGLYLAVAGNHILANPGTITGSIGVIMETIEFDEAMDKLGIKAQVIKSGQFKDMGSPFRPMRPEERELLQNMVLEVYEQFVADVAAGRPKLKVEQIRAIADGRVFTGEEALKQGLIDGYGGLNDAVLKAAELGKIAKPADAEIVYEDGRSSLVEELLGTRLGFLDKVDSGIQGGTTMKFIYRPGLF
jgi:protease-4